MLVNEIFFSIQGESTYAGLPCVLVRLAGCNIRCTWCDTPYSLTPEDGSEYSIPKILEEVKACGCNLVELTGGEPLASEGAKELLKSLVSGGYTVLLETNGTILMNDIPSEVVKIVDVKCPSSGCVGSFVMDNLKFIDDNDEIKFVIGSKEDYLYAKNFLEVNLQNKNSPVIFSPLSDVLSPKDLSEWILKDKLSVRVGLQIHKIIWGSERGR